MKKHVLSLVLTLALALSLVPAASAASTTPMQALAAFASYFSSGGETRDLPDSSRPSLRSLFYVDFNHDGIPEVMRYFGVNDEQPANKLIADVLYVESSGDALTVKRAGVFGAAGNGYDSFSLVRYGETYGIVQVAVPDSEYDLLGNPIRAAKVEDCFVFSNGSFSKTDNRPYETISAHGITNRFGLFTYKPTVKLSDQKLKVNGQDIQCEKYNIDGNNYFKLRDIAKLMNGTASQFRVGYDGKSNIVTIVTGSAYEANGTEMVIEADKSELAQISTQTISINGVTVSDLSVFNIGGNNYFKLRDLGNKLGFNVGWDGATSTVLVTSK